LALSAVAVVLGTAMVAGSFIFTDTISKSFDDLFEQASADVTVNPRAAFETDTFTGGQAPVLTVPEATLETVRSVEGVAEATGDVSVDGVYILDEDGQVLGTQGAPGLGLDWSGSSRSPLALTEGRGPQRRGEVAVDSVAADKGNLSIGDTVTLLMPQGPRQEATLVGVFTFGTSGNLAGATLTAFDPATAQSLLPDPDTYTTVSAYAADGISDEELKRRVDAALGAGTYEVLTRQEQSDKVSSDIKQGLGFINTALLAFAGVALFVGSFIIVNTFSMIVAQRTRELALLRAIGASRRQVTRSVLLEAAVVGLVGSAIGLALGTGIAAGLKALFSSIGLDLGAVGLVFAPRTVVVCVAVGLLVTLAASYAPARRASRVAPVAALRDDVALGSGALRVRAIVGAVLTALGVAAMVGAVTASGGASATYLGLGVLLTLVGVIALAPVIGIPVVALLGRPFRRSNVGRLSSENARRNPRRTAATASALMIGLALVTGFGVFAASANASVDKLVDDAVGADYVVQDAAGTAFSGDLATQLKQVPGVEQVVRERFGNARVDGSTEQVAGVDAEGLERALKLTFVSGDSSALGRGEVMVTDREAEAVGIALGQQLQVQFPTGRSADLTVGAIVEENPGLGPYNVPLEVWDRLGGGNRDQFLSVNLAAGADPTATTAALERAIGQYPTLQLQDQEEFKKSNKDQVNQLLYMIYGLLALAIIIAVLGIVNTLALSVIERTREIGLLRAIGMSRRQLRRMVVYESVVIAFFGALLGLGLGLVFGVLLQQVLESEGISELSVPYASLLVFLLLAGVVGVLAALWPARRAARLNVLRAITGE
ncbi:ABC transporter permease, partial [Motilibacter aurantiacus]|uniref:ABC transporter permease n=1 Tax=Motilibacter aurantiacus TaxID=2714955 RepID=UPI00140A49AC